MWCGVVWCGMMWCGVMCTGEGMGLGMRGVKARARVRQSGTVRTGIACVRVRLLTAERGAEARSATCE